MVMALSLGSRGAIHPDETPEVILVESISSTLPLIVELLQSFLLSFKDLFLGDDLSVFLIKSLLLVELEVFLSVGSNSFPDIEVLFRSLVARNWV
jgi:hypothetical protein